MALIVFTPACRGGRDDGDDVELGPDAQVEAALDARLEESTDAAPRECGTPATYGAVTLLDQYAGTAGPVRAPGHVFLDGMLDIDFDSLQLQLRKGLGGFARGELRPGIYAIEGDELSLATCGVCLRIQADVDGESYHATGGEVTLTQILPNLVGTASNLTFVEVDTGDGGETTPVLGGCTTAINLVSFDAPVEDIGGG